MSVLGIIAIALSVFSVVVVFPYYLVYGMPDWTSVGPRFKAWRISRAWSKEVSAKALEILADSPDLRYRCGYWPEYKTLCGQCCAYSRAEVQLQSDRANVNRLLREVLK